MFECRRNSKLLTETDWFSSRSKWLVKKDDYLLLHAQETPKCWNPSLECYSLPCFEKQESTIRELARLATRELIPAQRSAIFARSCSRQLWPALELTPAGKIQPGWTEKSLLSCFVSYNDLLDDLECRQKQFKNKKFERMILMSCRMNIAASELMTRMSELRQNRASANVTLNCEGKTIMAHSLIINMG